MAARTLRRRGGEINTWPGFVDALATLVMVIVFVLMIFTLFQFYLKDVISGREQALARLSQQIGELADMLALERRTTAELRLTVSQLSAELQSSTSTRDRLVQELAAANTRAEAATQQATRVSAELEDAFKTISADKEKLEVQLRELDALRKNVETLTIMRRELEAAVNKQAAEAEQGRQALSEERKLTEDARARADLSRARSTRCRSSSPPSIRCWRRARRSPRSRRSRSPISAAGSILPSPARSRSWRGSAPSSSDASGRYSASAPTSVSSATASCSRRKCCFPPDRPSSIRAAPSRSPGSPMR